jgi:hypothetical protein
MSMAESTPKRRIVVPFLLNVLVILLATCWFPLAQMQATLTTGDGTVVHETLRSMPLYESYQGLFLRQNIHHLKPVLIHNAMAFGITGVVWTLMLRGRRPTAGGASPDA